MTARYLEAARDLLLEYCGPTWGAMHPKLAERIATVIYRTTEELRAALIAIKYGKGDPVEIATRALKDSES